MWGYVGLTTAFVILAAILLWLLISSKAPVVLKIILIAFVMWYGAVLYYTPNNLMGWPVNVASFEELPKGALVLYVQVREPDKKTGDPGAIFFTLVSFKKNEGVEITFNPKNVFTYKGKSDPRVFKVPYSKPLHKELLAAAAQKNKKKGSMMRLGDKSKKGKQKKKGGGNTPENTLGKFEIITPYELLPKHQ